MKLCLRAETKPFEKRRALSPQDVAKLKQQNISILVESCPQSIFSAEEYAAVGADIIEKGAWKTLSKDWVILGLKELEESNEPLIHTHIYFAHCYKHQEGWQALLKRFHKGGGQLYDLEYLVENGRRIAAFGYWAGHAGAALSWALWQAEEQGALSSFDIPYSFASVDALQAHLKASYAQDELSAIVIGALGRSGKGATDFLKSMSCSVAEWDQAETQKGGPFPELLSYDLLINCVLMTSPNPPFISKELLTQNKKLSLIGDVSCDPTGPYNSLPIYTQATTFDKPLVKVNESAHDLYVMAIDHLPSLLPKESSEDFSAQLLPYLFDMSGAAWQHADDCFQRFSRQAISTD